MTVLACVQKYWLLIGVIGVIPIYLYFTIFHDSQADAKNLLQFEYALKKQFSRPLNVTVKKILFWNAMFGDSTFYFGKGDLFRDCPNVSRYCVATNDRSYASVQEFDAILFHANEINARDLPGARNEGQYYVFVNLESPESRPMEQQQLEKNYFNLTMTYRLDSDVCWPYSNVRRLKDKTFVAPSLETVWDEDTRNTNAVTSPSTWNEDAIIKMRRGKNKTAIWFVSNCRAKSKRLAYIEKLATYVDVDIFGLCGKKDGCTTKEYCFTEVVEPHYYFYMSFENTVCRDYVTEKLYNALKYNVVPVVYGGANYSLFAPPKSYINALDFDSPRQLANYLKRLIAQPSEYDKYFEWKKNYEIVGSNGHTICQLCQYLHENEMRKSYSPISAWYQEGKCPLQAKLKYLPYLTRKYLKNETSA